MSLTGSYVGIGVKPRVSAASATGPTAVRVTFNEAMANNAALLLAGNYTLTPSGGADARVVSSVTRQSALTVILFLDGDLTPGVDNYTVAVNNAGPTDLVGNTVDPAFDEALFGFAGTTVSTGESDDAFEHIGLLDPIRYRGAWGIGWANFGASDQQAHGLSSDIDHNARARGRLIAQYQGKSVPEAMMGLIGDRIQALDDIAYTVLHQHGLDTAWGFLLDDVGERVGLARNGLEDNAYRVRLGGRVLANASSGSYEDVRRVLDFLMQGLYDVRLEQAPPATMILRTAQLLQADGDAFAQTVMRAAPAGVRCIVEWELPVEQGLTFGFEDDNTAGPWAEFAEDSSAAGLWAEGYDGG